ncbi:MAG: NADH-ubiquinone oxidoreductase-F iron-sulfur binding region domain-containing protein [Chloroflexota bacterium]|nr:NADH-ubiquinone oxidoreductase-F iron-sulfur binding region domain-containing protein [Chloroflexota bacterium]
MSLPILSGARDWPAVLLSRAEVDPEAGIDAVEKAGAWEAYRNAVESLTPDAVISMISESGLRGRGGAGYPTGSKWRDCASQPETRRYVVANGFEADPGAQVDRVLMERDPHAVIEGVAIAAWAVRAETAIIAVSATAPVVVERLRNAIDESVERGYIGRGADGHVLDIEVREVAGSFVVGEETVLLRALEGRRAQPDQRPPYPSRAGLWGKPTVVNNIKTLAAVPWIVSHGAGAYASLGSADAPGTTLVQLGGAVRKPGIVEVPLGATVREILDGPGGFVQGTLKAVLVGGPTGGFLPPESLDTPLTYERLREAGALSGSGTLLALDESACIVDVATLMTRYLNDNACGKTIPCRIGTRRMAELGGAICSGHVRPSDAGVLEDLAADVRDAALCGLEADASNPLLSGMRYFAPEFEAHIARGECPAGVCQPIRLAGAVRS